MEPILEFDSGTVTLTGAAPEQCLNALAAVRLEFWDIEREDALLGGAEHGLLGLCMELAGVCDPGVRVDALAGHDDLVHMERAQHLLRLVADERKGFRLEPSAGQHDGPAFHVGQLHHQLHRVRNDGQALFSLSCRAI